MTEVLKITNADLVRVELKDTNGKTVRYEDFAWPGDGELLLNSGANGAVAHAPLANGLCGFARFPGAGITAANIAVSARPLAPGSTDPAKMLQMEIVSFA